MVAFSKFYYSPEFILYEDYFNNDRARHNVSNCGGRKIISRNDFIHGSYRIRKTEGSKNIILNASLNTITL